MQEYQNHETTQFIEYTLQGDQTVTFVDPEMFLDFSYSKMSEVEETKQPSETLDLTTALQDVFSTPLKPHKLS